MLAVGEVQKWLENHCHKNENVVGGLVALTNARDGAPVVAAQWPGDRPVDDGLYAAANASIHGSYSPIPANADGPISNVVALPLQVGDRAIGAIALELNATDSEITRQALDTLRHAAGNLARDVLPPPRAAAHVDAAAMLQLQAIVLAHPSLAVAAGAFAGALADLLHVDRVAVGFESRGRHQIAAISGAALGKATGELPRLLAAAMDEAVEQGAAIAFPANPDARPRITLAHAEFVRRIGGSVFTIPMVSQQRCVGAVSFARGEGAAPTAVDIAQCEHIVSMVAPVFELKHTVALPWHVRAQQEIRAVLHEPRRSRARIAAVAGVAALAAIAMLPVPYRVSAPARLEGAVQRALVAPADGFLRQVHVRPGDSVKADQVLAELAEDDLQLERRKWESELAQYENSASAALARTDRTQFVINQAKADEAQAQLDLIGRQLARTRVVAPFDGIVIQGDLSQSLGAPVERGDVLLTVAPAGQFRVMVEVDERDIDDVAIGKPGVLALGAFERSLPFTVERITPMATSRDGRNFFEVAGKLADASTSLRPGLQGVGKIEAGDRALGWIWTRRLLQWIRVTMWSWGG